MGNHYWARGSFLWNSRRPKRSNDRYYYEHNIGFRDLNHLFPNDHRYTLSFDYVSFNESYKHNFYDLDRYGMYDGILDPRIGIPVGYWNIETKLYRGIPMDGTEVGRSQSSSQQVLAQAKLAKPKRMS
jgi:hypothetical protein